MKAFWKVALVSGVFLVLVVFAVSVGYLMYKTQVFSNGVMVIPIKGFITLDECEVGLFSMQQCTTVSDVKEMLEKAEEDSTVKAVLLDVNSGGGSVVASREMMRVVKSSKKPVVAWIGEVGASGAYYVASASSYIVADRDSLTGSIGVIASFMHYYGLMDDLGVNVTVVKAGKSKDIGSPYRPMTEEERRVMQDIVDKIYGDFTADVAENRHLTREYVENISNGDIYLGSEALELDLIDAVGGFDEALSVAKNLGGIEGEPRIVKPEKKESILDLIQRVYGFKYMGFHILGYKSFLMV